MLEGIKMCAIDKASSRLARMVSQWFFRTFNETVKEDLMLTFHNFHTHKKIDKSYNATFVALIPKKVGANDLRDFRPISLITRVYKIIAKVV